MFLYLEGSLVLWYTLVLLFPGRMVPCTCSLILWFLLLSAYINTVKLDRICDSLILFFFLVLILLRFEVSLGHCCSFVSWLNGSLVWYPDSIVLYISSSWFDKYLCRWFFSCSLDFWFNNCLVLWFPGSLVL